jgi:cytidylate kinase
MQLRKEERRKEKDAKHRLKKYHACDVGDASVADDIVGTS